MIPSVDVAIECKPEPTPTHKEPFHFTLYPVGVNILAPKPFQFIPSDDVPNV